METIIGLLFVFLPVILKLIGKRFEQSGQPEKAKKLQDIADCFGSDDETDDSFEVGYDDDGHITSVQPKMTWKPEPALVVEKKPETQVRLRKTTEGAPAIKKKPVLAEGAPEKKREKIDPKKLVVYSEIMKPKFTE